MGISALFSTPKALRCTLKTCNLIRLEAPTIVIQVDYNVTQNTVIGSSWRCLFEASTLTKALNNPKHTVGFLLQHTPLIIVVIIPLHFPSRHAGHRHDFVQQPCCMSWLIPNIIDWDFFKQVLKTSWCKDCGFHSASVQFFPHFSSRGTWNTWSLVIVLVHFCVPRAKLQ